MRKLFQSEKNSMEMSFNSRFFHCEIRMNVYGCASAQRFSEWKDSNLYIRVLMLNKTLCIDSFCDAFINNT